MPEQNKKTSSAFLFQILKKKARLSSFKFLSSAPVSLNFSYIPYTVPLYISQGGKLGRLMGGERTMDTSKLSQPAPARSQTDCNAPNSQKDAVQ